MTNKIGWCSMTWNPCWGCDNQGECRKYCYARKIAKRFALTIAKKEVKFKLSENISYSISYLEFEKLFKQLYNFIPVFLESHFNKPLPKKPQKIFVGSMSEICYWKKEWMEKILEKTKQYPQHIFQFLTKFPKVYQEYDFPHNCWLGFTITNLNIPETSELQRYYQQIKRNKNNITFISYEPILKYSENMLYKISCDFNTKWIIVGAETGNRKGKVIPKKEWIDDIVNYCKKYKIPVFLKDNLKNVYSDLIQKFPERR